MKTWYKISGNLRNDKRNGGFFRSTFDIYFECDICEELHISAYFHLVSIIPEYLQPHFWSRNQEPIELRWKSHVGCRMQALAILNHFQEENICSQNEKIPNIPMF